MCRTCLQEALWCDGIQHCPDDEKGCPSLSGLNVQQREMIFYHSVLSNITNKESRVFNFVKMYIPDRLNVTSFLKLNKNGNPE